MLSNTPNIISNGMEGLKEKYEAMMEMLQASFDVLVENRKELMPPEEEKEEAAAQPPAFDDFNLKEDEEDEEE